MNLSKIKKRLSLSGTPYNRRGIIMLGGMFATLLAFIIIWCSQTTFRAMSDWMLYIVNIFAALLLTLPAIVLRRVWIQTALMLLLDALLISNLMYCRTYFTAIPPDSYLLAGNLGDFTASVYDSLRWADITLPLIALATTAWAYISPARRPWRPRLPYVCVTIAAGAVAVIGMVCKGGFYNEYDRLTQSCYYSTCGVPIYTVGGHLIYNIISDDTPDTPEIRAEIADWNAEKERLRPYTPLPDSVPRRRNLVIVLLESFESWLTDTRIEGKEITPYINSLIREPGTLYAPNMLTQVASGRSIDCQLLLGSGLLPMQNAVYSMKYPDRDYPSLMKAMKADRNARCAILTCDKPITWNQEAIARSMGYDTLLDRSSWKIDEVIGNPAKLSDGSFMRQAVEKLRSGEIVADSDRPFLLTFVTYSGHNPFRLPDNLRDPAFSLPKGKYPERMADYVTMAHYTDSRLRTLIEYLRSRPDYAETLVVITGDHEGLAGDRAEILRSAAARGVVSPLQLTPFIVLNSPVAGRRDTVMGQIDMYPTLLSLLGLDSYGWKGQGQNILMPGRVEAAISSMTGETLGDTTRVAPGAMRNLRSARRISDLTIKTMKH